MLKKFLRAFVVVLMFSVLIPASLRGDDIRGGSAESSCASGENAFRYFARNNFAFLVWNGVFFAAILGAAAFGKRK